MSQPAALPGAIVLPDGVPVRGRGLCEPVAPGDLPELGLYLGRPGTWRSGWHPDPPPQWPVLWIDWPDFRTPRDGEQAAASILQAHRAAAGGALVEVACGGGVGRTGTVIACLALLTGHPAEDAVDWTRRHYRRRAVETPGQRRWVHWFAERASDAGPAVEGFTGRR